MLLRWRLPLSLADTALVLDEEFLPQAFRLIGKGAPFAADVSDPFELFSGLLDDHLQPLFQARSSAPRVSRWARSGSRPNRKGRAREYMPGLGARCRDYRSNRMPWASGSESE